MGNCCVSYRIILPCCVKVDPPHKQGNVLKIVKSDGKVMEFTSPILPVPSTKSTSLPPPDSFMEEDSEKTSSTRRIRIVVTKKELQQLLANQVSMEELIMQQQQLEKTTSFFSNLESSSTWKPALAAIPEGVE